MQPRSNAFLRHIDKLNSWNPQHFRPFFIDGVRAGYVKDYMCQVFSEWPHFFKVSSERVDFNPVENDFQSRNRILDRVIHNLIEQQIINHYADEPYPVTGRNRDHLLAVIDRGAAAYFGIKAYGQHLNGYVKTEQGIKLWVARRAADRLHFPDRLDNLVAGGLPHHISLRDNLLKECAEEADIPAELVNRAQATAAVTYCCETDKGLKPDTLFCYDLELPAQFQPVNTDGEVADFKLLPLPEVIDLVRNTDEFKLNCNLVIVDFCIRHGFIKPEDPDYLQIVEGLHTSL